MVQRALRRLLWLAFIAAGTAAADTETFTPAHIAKLRIVREAKISPDGQLVAYTLAVPRTPGKDEDGVWRSDRGCHGQAPSLPVSECGPAGEEMVARRHRNEV